MAHIPALSPVMLGARLDLRKIMRPNGFIYASDDKLFRYAFFGRDSIEAAEDLLPYRKDFIYKLIIRIAELQGTTTNKRTEEEPGKIHHEYRSDVMEGKRVPESSLKILKSLSDDWGGTGTEMLYYGACDTTPLYVRLVADYQKRHKTDILEHSFANKDGEVLTVAESVARALGWTEQNIAKHGFLSFHRTNPRGMLCQTWKDSPTSIVHANGALPNYAAPIATIELQSHAYDAFTLGAHLLAEHDPKKYKQDAKRWREIAKTLRAATLKTMWMDTANRFATGVDKDPHSAWRVIGSNTSNQAALLEGTMLDDLPEDERLAYVTALVKTIYSNDFLTPAGIRCRSLAEFSNVDFQDYHGSWAVWVKETYDVAKGLRKQGFRKLADQLELRILKSVDRAGSNREFFYVAPSGRVMYQPARQRYWRRTVIAAKTIAGTNIPETGQAWSASAVYSIIARKTNPRHALPPHLAELQHTLYTNLPKVDASTFLLPGRLMGFVASQGYAVDLNAGRHRDNSWRDRIAPLPE